MKLKVWNEQDINNESDSIYIRLHEYSGINNLIKLFMCDSYGNPISNGSILAFDNKLKVIILNNNISEKYPFKTDIRNHPIAYKISDLEIIMKQINDERIIFKMRNDLETTLREEKNNEDE